MNLRIGISTRIAQAEGYCEPRDCLAQDWARFFKSVSPQASWMMLPNIGSDIGEYIERWQLNAFVLSGGNDLGDEPLRDVTERDIIRVAQETASPLLGICRGVQLLVSHFGGELRVDKRDSQRLKQHAVRFTSIPLTVQAPVPAEVNSYHNYVIASSHVLPAFAFDATGLIEGVYSAEKNILGIMWHPERTHPTTAFDKEIIRRFFYQGDYNG